MVTVSAADTRAFVLAQRARRQAAGADRHRELKAVLEIAVGVLSQLGARRIWVFGSFARGDPGPDSDLDLAVEGLSATALIEALARIWQHTSLPVDLVSMESAPDSLRERVLAEGNEVWRG